MECNNNSIQRKHLQTAPESFPPKYDREPGDVLTPHPRGNYVISGPLMTARYD